MNNLQQESPILFQLAGLIKAPPKIDKKTLHQAKRVVADTVGTAWGGIHTPAFQTAIKSKQEIFGDGSYPIWGTDQESSLFGAIFYNTLSICSTDFDEGHRKAVGHPGSTVVALALILGKHLNKSYDEILKALVVGYETGTRYSNARYKEKIETYSTGRWGAIASATTAAVLLNLNLDQTAQALSLAATLSPAMLGGSSDVSTGAMSKEGGPWAVQQGLQCAFLAKNNFTGVFTFIDDYQDIDYDVLLDGFGDDWLIKSNYFKPFACCRWLHSAIEAGVKLRNEKLFDLNQVEKIEIRIFQRAIDLIRTTYPENPVQAQFHLPYVLATAFISGKVEPKNFTMLQLEDQKIKEIITKIVCKPHQEYTNAFPGRLPSKVILTLTDGSRLSEEVFIAPWDAINQPTDEELFQKFAAQVDNDSDNLWDSLMLNK